MNITRMSNEKTAPELQTIQPEIERLKDKHKKFLEILKRTFADSFVSAHTIKSNNQQYELPSMHVLIKLEDYIAAKIQLLNNLEETDAFYEIQAEHINLAKDYYVDLYTKFSQS